MCLNLRRNIKWWNKSSDSVVTNYLVPSGGDSKIVLATLFVEKCSVGNTNFNCTEEIKVGSKVKFFVWEYDNKTPVVKCIEK